MKHFDLIKDIFSIGYKVTVSGSILKPNGKELPYQIQNSGYKLSHIYIAKRRYAITHHQLVWVWFYDKDVKFINHIDGDKLNNHPSNLEECTVGENNSHAYKLKLKTPLYGERSGRTPLSKDDVSFMRKLYSQGWMQKTLSEIFGMKQNSISYIVNRRTWFHI